MPFTIQRLKPLPIRKNPRPVESFARARRSIVPAGGWTQETFQSGEGARLLRDIISVRRLAIRENAGKMTRAVSAMMEDEFGQVLNAFVAKIAKPHAKTLGSNLVSVILNLEVPDGSEDLWLEALNEVFEEGTVAGRILRVFRPIYQSVLSHIFKKTSVLTQPPPLPTTVSRPVLPVTAISTPPIPPPKPLTKPQQAKLIAPQVDKLCAKVTCIDETTRNRMAAMFREHIKSGTTIAELIRIMKDRFPAIATSRIPTIVRNELSMAANAAQLLSFQNLKTLTHCSVVGCQAVEDDGPKYKGFPTCNIRNVPVADLHLVEFHINHTGSWVPSGFKQADGTAPVLMLGNAPGIGHYDDPNALRHVDRRRAGLGRVARPN